MTQRLRTSTRSANLKADFINTLRESDTNSSEQLNYPLPQVIERELLHGISREEIAEKILYFKERSTYYLGQFNTPGILPAARDHFQFCCEYHTTHILIWETALEKLSGRIL